ncbi:MAG TPA: tRNA uridine-5-carboxymethylaminomethyl(34) synthesis enzyme MnmG [Candidatus Cloacimonadota bacterium]|nr:tRNA uridine-5-carboxymethylaminomethyl(34) synthesis enzyme MnmG [Candidatus Cloacimonadota bacterium]
MKGSQEKGISIVSKNSTQNYDIIVVGAGNAGIEAAMATAKIGAKTALFTIKLEAVGRLSCNPSIGGPAKGHLAREIDALGGVIGYVADLTGIHFRMLNKKKGPAVWAPRTQNDRQAYSLEIRNIVEKQDNLELIEDMIVDLITEYENERLVVKGVRSILGKEYFAAKVILCNGTFLKGKIHVGNVSYAGGRSGEPADDYMSNSLIKLGFQLARFKTGTPPRIDLRTVDFNKLETQAGDDDPQGFSFFSDLSLQNKISCYITHTTSVTHQIIRDNLKLSSLYGGFIEGIGPRYCPSVEDKIVKFADKDQHHVFIEPEGLHTVEAYVNGISNSLPAHIQEQVIRSVPALEKAKIMRYAYAIEYDYIVPDELLPSMETKRVSGLYLAGQINGTSGYEEAAAQGICAGINAVRALDNKEMYVFDRSQSYLGVLIDDLVTKGTNEPYRLFTSRAEHRLSLRQDNADERLMPIGYELGLVSDVKWQRFLKQGEIVARETEFLKQTNSHQHPDLSQPQRLYTLLKRPEIEYQDLEKFGYQKPADITKSIEDKISINCKYEGYLKRQQEDIEKFAYLENFKISHEIDYLQIEGVAIEAREKLNKIQPVSLGQAVRVPGVNYTDAQAIMIYLKKNKKLEINKN